MKRKIVILTVWLVSSDLIASAQNTWVNLSGGLKEMDIRSVAVDPKNPKIIFAGSEKRLYRTLDQGKSWKGVLDVRGSDNAIHCIYIDPSNPKEIYVGTHEGVQRSEDGGERWNAFFDRIASKARIVFYIAPSPVSSNEIWLGTGEGLFSIHKRTYEFKKINGLPSISVYSIAAKDEPAGTLFAATEQGIFRSLDKGVHWEHVFANAKVSENAEENQTTINQQFGVEEMPNQRAFSGFASLTGQNKIYAGSQNGILQNSSDGRSWQPMQNQNIPDRRINAITSSSKIFYVATHRGVFRWDPDKNSFDSIYKGLESEEVRTVFYSFAGDTLLAGTKKGLFQLPHPETQIPSIKIETDPSKETSGLFSRFQSEPAIREIQNAAILYAEVHPKKIEEWRAAASRRAILPTVSLGSKLSRDRRVDVDRGGTNDPDKFITGPDDKNFDWSVSVSWNLGDLIWNNDQTSIDSRSKLMVELRDDILNEVTHLYYERRRLQMEMLTAADTGTPDRLEKEIRLEELTAGIDALTGGYLSQRLKKEGALYE